MNAETNDHNTALHFAVKNEYVRAVEWLLQHGANVQIVNDAGWRPTTVAIAKGWYLLDVLPLDRESMREQVNAWISIEIQRHPNGYP